MKILRSSLYVTAVIAMIILAASCTLPTATVERKALVIGISDYIYLDPPDPYRNGRDLTYPSIDATDLQAVLKASDWVVDTPLIDHAATKAQIQSRISTFFEDLSPEDTALIYYSGHGTEIDGISYLVPSDYDGNPYNYSQMISPAELSDWISSSIDTKNIIFIADSCNSGGFIQTGDSIDGIASPYDSSEDATVWITPIPTIALFGELLSKNATANGNLEMIAISAAGALELSYENSDLENGIFTHFLLEAAIHGDKDRNGFVTCTEAYTYAARKVDSYWNDLYPTDYGFYPHISGGWRDLVLF